MAVSPSTGVAVSTGITSAIEGPGLSVFVMEDRQGRWECDPGRGGW